MQWKALQATAMSTPKGHSHEKDLQKCFDSKVENNYHLRCYDSTKRDYVLWSCACSKNSSWFFFRSLTEIWYQPVAWSNLCFLHLIMLHIFEMWTKKDSQVCFLLKNCQNVCPSCTRSKRRSRVGKSSGKSWQKPIGGSLRADKKHCMRRLFPTTGSKLSKT